MRKHEGLKSICAARLRHGGRDHVDAGNEFADEAEAHRCKAFGERVIHHGISITSHTQAPHTKRKNRDTLSVKASGGLSLELAAARHQFG
jgi:hypothetical protein